MADHQKNPFTTEAFSNRLRYEAFSQLASDINHCINLDQIGEALLRHFKFILGHKAAKFYVVLADGGFISYESIRGEISVNEEDRWSDLPEEIANNLQDEIPKLYSGQESMEVISKLFNSAFGIVSNGLLLSRYKKDIGGFSIFVTKKVEAEYTQSDIKFGNLVGEYLFTKVRQIHSEQKLKAIYGELQTAHSKIELQQRGLVASLHYAKRIQSSLVSNLNVFNQVVNKKGFVYFKSKAIVTGDFFWSYSDGKKKIIALGDCTGHGVPGAFLTILAVNALESICKNSDILKPSVVLELLNEKVKTSLNKKGVSGADLIDDGLDAAVVLIDEEKKEIVFSGAKRPLYIYHSMQEKLVYVKGTNMPIGNNLYYQNTEFESHTIPYESGDRIYINSDGFQDQFGGEFDKKFKINQFEKMLRTVQKLPISKQYEYLDKTFNDWKNKSEQTDDVLVIGVELE